MKPAGGAKRAFRRSLSGAVGPHGYVASGVTLTGAADEAGFGASGSTADTIVGGVAGTAVGAGVLAEGGGVAVVVHAAKPSASHGTRRRSMLSCRSTAR